MTTSFAWLLFSAVSKEGATAPRTGFFHDFGRGEVLARRYVAVDEDVVAVSAEDADRMRRDLRNLDSGLGPYPYDAWKRWVSLTDKISDATLARLEPANGRIQSVTELVPQEHFTSRSAGARSDSADKGSSGVTEMEDNAEEGEESVAGGQVRQCGQSSEEAKVSFSSTKHFTVQFSTLSSLLFSFFQLPKMRHRPGTEIRYTSIPEERYPAGSTPSQITKHSMDSSYQLEQYLSKFTRYCCSFCVISHHTKSY